MVKEKGIQTYLEKKELDFTIEKTKIIRFRKRKGKINSERWRWQEKEIEKVEDFIYLGYKL